MRLSHLFTLSGPDSLLSSPKLCGMLLLRVDNSLCIPWCSLWQLSVHIQEEKQQMMSVWLMHLITLVTSKCSQIHFEVNIPLNRVGREV